MGRLRLVRKIADARKSEQGIPVNLAPTGLTAVANPDRSITLDWDDVPGFNAANGDLYRVYEDLTVTGPVATTTVSTRTSPPLLDGPYTYEVSAVVGGVESGRSNRAPATVATTSVLGLLPYAPPAGWQNFQVRRVSNSTIGSGSISLSAGVDYRIVYDEPITRRLQIHGGRHLVIIGGEHNINVNNGGYYDSAESYSNNGGLEIIGQTGIVFIEGFKVHGAHAMDSIRSSNTGSADVIIQNSHLFSDRVVPVAKNADGVPSDGVYHTDGFQTWRGPRSLTCYNVTIVNLYQGGMIGDGALKGADWGPTLWHRVNMRTGAGRQHTRLINFVKGPEGRLKGPFTFKDVYYLPDDHVSWNSSGIGGEFGAFYSHMKPGTDAQGREYAQWDTSNFPSVLGASDGAGGPLRLYRGMPPGGEDYMPAAQAGIGYVSPGYVTGAIAAPKVDGRIVGPTGMVSTLHPSLGSGVMSVRLKTATDEAMTQNVAYTTGVTCNAQGVAKHTVNRTPGTYFYRVAVTTSDGEAVDAHPTIGRVRVPDTTRNSLAFTFGACCNAADSDAIGAAADRADDYFLHLGDMWYADTSGTSLSNFRAKMRAKMTAPNHHRLTATTMFAYKGDDHDSGMNDDANAGSDPTALANFNAVLREFMPFPFPSQGHYFTWDDGPYRFVVLDERSFASPASNTDNSTKTRLGAAQKTWLEGVVSTCPTDRVMVMLWGGPWAIPAEVGEDSMAGYLWERDNYLLPLFVNSGKDFIMLSGDQHALAVNDGSTSPGGFPVYCGAPLSNGTSAKGTWTSRYGPTGTMQAYGRVVGTRTATQVSTAYTGYTADNTARLVHTRASAIT